MIVIAAMMKAKIIIEVGIGYDLMKILRIDLAIWTINKAFVYTNQNDVRRVPNRPKLKRANTFKAIGRILGKWKRGNSIRPITENNICIIWLREYEEGQKVIQLKCGDFHWFHVHCLEAWAHSNRKWPMWGEDFIETAKKEQDEQDENARILQNQDESKQMENSNPVRQSRSHIADSLIIENISLEHRHDV